MKRWLFISLSLVALIFIFYSAKPQQQPKNTIEDTPKNQTVTMVRLTYSGGMCPEGPCGKIIEINAAGTVIQKSGANDSKPVIKKINQDRLDRFNEAMSIADLQKLKSKKFEGECPTNFDGQKVVYEFFTTDGNVLSVDSCEFALDPKDPIFISIDKIVTSDVYGTPK